MPRCSLCHALPLRMLTYATLPLRMLTYATLPLRMLTYATYANSPSSRFCHTAPAYADVC